MVKLNFRRQYQLAEKLKSYFPDEEQRRNVKILDVAAGTGLVGEGLKRAGFVWMDAVDGNQAMLDKLMKKGIYKKSVRAILGNKEDSISPDIANNAYDVVIIMGGFAQSHLPLQSLYQVLKVLHTLLKDLLRRLILCQIFRP